MRIFLRDILEEKRRRGDGDAEAFRAVIAYEFAAGLNATAEGAASAMRRWVANRPLWVSDAQHARRLAALAAIEGVLNRQPMGRDRPFPAHPGARPGASRPNAPCDA